MQVDRGDVDVEFDIAEEQHRNNMEIDSAPYEPEPPPM